MFLSLAKGLKGVESNGTSDPFVVIVVDGKKRDHLQSKHVDKTIAPSVRPFCFKPQLFPLTLTLIPTPTLSLLPIVLTHVFPLKWNQEFVFTISSSSSSVELQVFDWNRILSNVLLGTTKIDVGSFATETFQDLWLPLDTCGDVHIFCQVTPILVAPTGATEHMNIRLSQMRLQLESTAYYPGQVVRGALIYGLLKPKKVHSIRVAVDGRTHTYWTTGAKNKTYYYSLYVFFNATSVMVGGFDKKEAVTMEPGSHIYPFEYVLPMDLPPSTNDESPYHTNYIRYCVTGFSDVAGSANKSTRWTFRVFPSPHHSLRTDFMSSTSSKLNGAFILKQNVTCSITGPAQVWSGETYTVHAKIENQGQKPLESLSIVLKNHAWACARVSGRGRWVRTRLLQRKADVWEFKTLPQFPVAPGSAWEGDITITMPHGIRPSIHCTLSPLIQNSYSIKVKLATAGNIFTKASGETKYPVVVSDRALIIPGVKAPVEPMGQLGRIITAPAPPGIHPLLVPTQTLNGKEPICAGRALGEIAAYPGAVMPIQAICKVDGPEWRWVKHCLITEADWTPGTVPSWIKDDDGLKPLDDGPVEFVAMPTQPM